MKMKTFLPAVLLSGIAVVADAAEQQSGDAAQANNPLANMTAFNMQNYYIGDVSGTDSDANQFWFRYAQPFSLGESKWLLRGSLPINTFPTGANGGHKTGTGDLNLFASWLIDTGNPAVSFGFGPQITAPTASEHALGTEKWSAGLVNVLFNASSPKFQYGYLASWQHSFAGEEQRSDVNLGTFQPFLFYQLGGGTYLRAAPIWVYNFQNDSYSVPMGLGVGQVIKQGKTVYNFFVEPQGSVADDGPGQPRWQIFAGFNLQFMN
ncbi:hypothetical protein BBY84_08630 [Salmonella enterica]|nr:hypothetical protein [Salmonella enterica]ECI8008350.1 hypothetical protein [Salmonella enterica subsp. enterica]HEC8150761.1 hypothetical protein [Salmonella enterica subsp. enterica serovar Mississippi]EBM7133316.1 hypothetical protein [Salmonella enterica]EJU7420727.1 hypothetical protein [Salmonella enterica]